MKELILMILIGTFIGWVTNYIAIKLLFRPYNEINILGFKIQGVIPKRRSEIALNIGQTVNTQLISIKDITNTINSMELEVEIDKIVGDIVDKKIKGDFLSKNPMLKMFVSDSVIDKIKACCRHDDKSCKKIIITYVYDIESCFNENRQCDR
jgi:uncharacterized membrane protein YheB (UPF0754 family)